MFVLKGEKDKSRAKDIERGIKVRKKQIKKKTDRERKQKKERQRKKR